MVVSSSYKEFVSDVLSGIGGVSIRSMFGGAGVFCDGVMFALIADDVLYLKVDDTNLSAFEDMEMSAFTYEAKGKPMSLSYWEVPPSLFDDPDELTQWAQTSLAIAVAAKNKKQKKS